MTQKLEIKVNIVDCSGCRLCELVCTLFHEGVVNPEKARVRVSDKYDQSLFEPHICRLCDSPDCVKACPVEALTQDSESGIITVHQELCDGCQACIEACPYDAMQWNDELEMPFVCDRCGGQPTCVQFCTSGALVLPQID